MAVKCKKLVCPVFFYVLLICPVYAEPFPTSPLAGENAFSKNVRLASQQYNQGDYAQAKVFYEQALNQALSQDKPHQALYYNLGSVCYKLGLFDQSKSYFKKLLDHSKLKAVAYYNLALIENKQSNKVSAIAYFNKSKKFSTDLKLTELVDQQLLKLKRYTAEKSKKDTKKDWHAYLYISPGYDSNIRFAPLDIASNESGGFIQGIGIFDKRIAGGGDGKKEPALLITSTIFLSNYFSTDFNDYNIFDIGLRYLLPVNQWRNTIELNIKKSTYGHADYQDLYVATFKTRRRFSDGNTLRLRYRYEQIDSLNPLFDHLEGDRQRLRLGYQFKWPEDSVNLWYELEINNRKNTGELNYSPTRNTLRLRYEKKFNATNKAYAELEYRHSDYDSTAFQNRLDKRTGFSLAYVNDIASDWQFLARWGFRRNRSAEPDFSYERHVVLLTLRKSF